MGIELIAVDLDGTALRTDKTVSPRTVRALSAAAARGVHVVPATGRVAKMVLRELREIPGVCYALTSNGASVVDLRDGSVLYSNPIPPEHSRGIVRFFVSRGILTEAYVGGVSYANAGAAEPLRRLGLPESFFDYVRESQIFVEDLEKTLDTRGWRLEKINIPYLPEGERERIAAALLATGNYSVTSSGGCNLEVNAATANKGDGLAHLCRLLGVAPDRVMAVGDGDNDVSMLRFAGLGVAMGNAVPEARRAARAVTAANDKDGLAQAVERYVLAD